MSKLGMSAQDLSAEMFLARLTVSREQHNNFTADGIWLGIREDKGHVRRPNVEEKWYSWLRRKIKTIPSCLAGFWERGRHRGLRDLITEQPTVREMNTGYKGEKLRLVNVPFRDIIINSSFPVLSPDAVQRGLIEYYETEFKGHFLEPPRVRLYNNLKVHPENDHKLRTYFGFGVYIPEESESITWLLKVAKPEGGEWHALYLPQDEIAGFYLGQEGLAFSGTRDHTPVTTKVGGIIPDDTTFFFGRPSQRADVTFQCIVHSPPEDPNKTFSEQSDMPQNKLKRSSFLKKGGDLVIVDQDGKRRLRLMFERAPDRLPMEAERPKGPHLSLEGILLPEIEEAGKFRNIWIDLTAWGTLPEAPFDNKLYSVAFWPEVTALYDWQRRDYRLKMDKGKSVRVEPLRDRGNAEESFSLTVDELCDESNAPELWRKKLRRDDDAFGFVPLNQDETLKIHGRRRATKDLICPAAGTAKSASGERDVIIDFLEGAGGAFTALSAAEGVGAAPNAESRRILTNAEFDPDGWLELKADSSSCLLVQFKSPRPSGNPWLAVSTGNEMKVLKQPMDNPLILKSKDRIRIGFYEFSFNVGEG